MKDKEMIEEMVKSCKNCICNPVCDKKLNLRYFFDNHDCEYYQPKLPEDSVANQKLFDEFVKFAKDKFNLTIVKDNINGKEYTFEELFGNVFEDGVVLSREELEQMVRDRKSVV